MIKFLSIFKILQKKIHSLNWVSNPNGFHFQVNNQFIFPSDIIDGFQYKCCYADANTLAHVHACRCVFMVWFCLLPEKVWNCKDIVYCILIFEMNEIVLHLWFSCFKIDRDDLRTSRGWWHTTLWDISSFGLESNCFCNLISH